MKAMNDGNERKNDGMARHDETTSAAEGQPLFSRGRLVRAVIRLRQPRQRLLPPPPCMIPEAEPWPYMAEVDERHQDALSDLAYRHRHLGRDRRKTQNDAKQRRHRNQHRS